GGLFGGRAGASGWGPMPGADQEAELELTVEEAYRGGRRTVTLAGPVGPRTYTVDIPPGVVDGQRIRLAGQGGRGTGSGTPGDLFAEARILVPPRPTPEETRLFEELAGTSKFDPRRHR